MNRALLFLLIFLLFCFSKSDLYAAQFFGTHQKLIKIYDLPNTEDYTSTDGKLFDFGYKYSLFDIVFLPVFESGNGQIVGYVDDENYVLLSEDDIQNLSEKHELDNLSELIQIPFWDAWGGKIVGIFLLFFTLFIFVLRNKK